MIRDVLNQIVKHTIGVFEDVAITGTSDKTLIQSCDKNKSMFLYSEIKAPIPEFEGKFALTKLSTLSTLLNLVTLKNEDVVAVRQARTVGAKKVETVVSFQFTDIRGKKNAQFTKAAELVAEQATIGHVPWDVSVALTKSALDEFSAWATLPIETITASTDSGDLIFSVSNGDGDFNMVFASGVQAELKTPVTFDIVTFQRFLKFADKSEKITVGFNKQIVGVTVETPLVDFKYYFRAIASK